MLMRNVMRSAQWNRALRNYRQTVQAKLEPTDKQLQTLISGWGNAAWSADVKYLRAILKEIQERKNLTILECGTGLTTILIGIIGDENRHRVISLEHHSKWHQKISDELENSKVGSVSLTLCPLKDYGNFEWYDTSNINLSAFGDINLVICDGPPGSSKGGRIGLPYRCATSFSHYCLVLADDTHRNQEQMMLEQWVSEFSATINRDKSASHFTAVTFSQASR